MTLISKKYRTTIVVGTVLVGLVLFLATTDLSSWAKIKKEGLNLLQSELFSWVAFSFNLWILTRIFDKKVPLLSKVFDSTEEANKDAV
jgi:hypothetical protein